MKFKLEKVEHKKKLEKVALMRVYKGFWVGMLIFEYNYLQNLNFLNLNSKILTDNCIHKSILSQDSMAASIILIIFY